MTFVTYRVPVDPETLAALRTAGLWWPGMPDEDGRLDLLAFWLERGVTVEALRVAATDHNLVSAGVELAFDVGTLSLKDVGTELGKDLDWILRLTGLLGIPTADPDRPVLTEAQADLFRLIGPTDGTLSSEEVEDIIRAAATSLTLLAESLVTGFVGGAEARFQELGTMTERDRAEATALVASAGVRFGQAIGALFGHHLQAAIHRQRSAMRDAPNRQVRRLAIAFVDLVGFTPLSSELDAAALLDFVRSFQVTAADAAARHGGRIVKHIGDEVMIAAVDPVACARIALELIDAVRSEETVPRGGLAYGDVAARQGDYYGRVVNVAARLVDQAVPGEVLAEASVPLGGLPVQPAGRRQLKGFADPVAVVSVALA